MNIKTMIDPLLPKSNLFVDEWEIKRMDLWKIKCLNRFDFRLKGKSKAFLKIKVIFQVDKEGEVNLYHVTYSVETAGVNDYWGRRYDAISIIRKLVQDEMKKELPDIWK